MNGTTSNVLNCCTLIYVDVEENSNKVWQGSLFQDDSLLVEWGRVGHKLQTKNYQLGSLTLAQSKFERTKRQKLRKGYTEAQIVSADISQNTIIDSETLEAIAAKQIECGRDPRAKELIRYLVRVNIHNIISQTDITFNPATGTFRTPLGLVTTQAIAQARDYLCQIAKTRRSNSSKVLPEE